MKDGERDSLSMDFWCPSAWAYHRDRIGCLRAPSTSSMQRHGYFHVVQHACNDCKFHSPVDPITRFLCIDCEVAKRFRLEKSSQRFEARANSASDPLLTVYGHA